MLKFSDVIKFNGINVKTFGEQMLAFKPGVIDDIKIEVICNLWYFYKELLNIALIFKKKIDSKDKQHYYWTNNTSS